MATNRDKGGPWWLGYVWAGRWSLVAGFLGGAAAAGLLVSANRYLAEGLYGAALGGAAARLNSVMLVALMAGAALAVVFHTYHRITRSVLRSLLFMALAGLLIWLFQMRAESSLRQESTVPFMLMITALYHKVRESGLFALALIPAAWGLLALLGLLLNLILFPLRRIRDPQPPWPPGLARAANAVAGPQPLAAILFLFLAVNITAAVALRARRPESPVNIILVSIDTLRADHVSAWCEGRDMQAVAASAESPAPFVVCLDYDEPVTPNIDELAAEGVFFEEAFVPSPWTLPSHASLFTSLYPSTHGAETYFSYLPPYATTVAERFRDRGYRTGAVVSHIFLSSFYGLDQGFMSLRYLPDAKADWVTDRSLEFLTRNRSRPFFLFVHYFDPHSDYAPPEGYAEKFADPDYRGSITGRQGHFQQAGSEADLRQVLALYAGEVNFVDDQLGRIFRAVKELGLEGNTYIIVTSDHGEEFLDRGGWEHATLYDEIMRAPLVMQGPSLPRGRRIRSQVRLIDIPPTILELAGLGADPAASGRSLVPLASGPESEPAAGWPAFGEVNAAVEGLQNQYMLRLPPVKYIRKPISGDELYIIAENPTEDTAENMAAELEQAAGKLRNLIEEYIRLTRRRNRELREGGRLEPMIMDEEAMKRLRREFSHGF